MNIEESKKILDKFVTEHKLFNIKHSDGLEEAIETLLTAYEKEKEANKKLDKEAQGYLEELAGDGSMNIRRIQELEAELEKEKEKNKELRNQLNTIKDIYYNTNDLEELSDVLGVLLSNLKEE